MTVRRMDNMGVVVEDLAAAVAFFVALGLEVEGEATVEGPDVDRLVGLDGVRCDLAFVRTPDGHGRLELMRFHSPAAVPGSAGAPVNATGFRRVLFAVDRIEEVLERLGAHGAEPIGDVVTFGSDRMCYVRGPEGIVVALADTV